MKIETKCLHEGYKPENGGPGVMPIVQSTTYRFDSTAKIASLFDMPTECIYSRFANPTCDAVEKKIASLEGGVGAMLTSSGQAASLLSILNLCSAGDSFIAASTIYGGTINLFGVTLKKLGIECIWADAEASEEEVQKLFKPNTKAVFGETLANPALTVFDIEKWANIAHKNNVPLIVDNTFATPVLCRPIEWGVNVVTHSATKWIGGHGTSLGGVVVDGGNFDWGNGRYPLLSEPSEGYHGFNFWKECGKTAFATRTRCEGLRDIGPCISPFNAFLLTQGLETLSLRVQRSVDNALAVAEWLEKHPKIEHVSYPGLKSSKYHTLAKKYLRNGFGGVLTFRVKGSAEQASKIVDNLGLISHLANVGDAKTLLIHPASTTHAQLGEQELAASGVYPNLLRLSLGIEHIDDIKEDLNEALKHL